VDVIAQHSTQLAKLRHSPMRRIMSRLTTVAQAARLCRMPAESLVAELNAALGIAVDISAQDADVDSDTLLTPPAFSPKQVVELDVREDLRNGKEPFSKIMSAVTKLEGNQVLHLRTTFEPVPLFAVLEKRGFEHSALRHAADDWSVWFHRGAAPRRAGESTATPSHAPAASTTVPTALTDMRIDVRGLEPPEPMLRTLEALEALPDSCALLHVNVRVPQLLFPILRERGFDFQLDETHHGEVHVRIWRRPSESHNTTKESAMSQPPVSSPASRVLELDVRPIPPRDKHPSIFGMFDSLAPGEAMILINDHDPKPLRYQLIAEHPDTFEWTFLEEGPMVWRVRIDRK
jgi:uncharacterized protein (DUF2249 family)